MAIANKVATGNAWAKMNQPKPGRGARPCAPTAIHGQPPVQEGPPVPQIIDALDEPRAEILTLLRDQTLALADVAEKAVYDGFCKEWTPAYYVRGRRGKRQPFHVHDFPTGLRGTIFVGINTLDPVLLGAENVFPGFKTALIETRGARTKQLRVPLASPEDAARFAQMVRVKWEFELRMESK